MTEETEPNRADVDDETTISRCEACNEEFMSGEPWGQCSVCGCRICLDCCTLEIAPCDFCMTALGAPFEE